MENLKIYTLDNRTIQLYKDCFDSNGSSKKIENIEWQFLKGTEKKVFVNIAFDELKKKTAAIYAVSCVKFKLNNKLYQGTQSMDTMTDIDYRGLGLFAKLAKNVTDNCINDGLKLVYGFPNGISVHVYKKKMEWRIIDPIPFLIKPLKTKYFTNKIKFISFLPNIPLSFSRYKEGKNLRIIVNNSFSEQVNSVWEQFSKNIKVAVNRDLEYLNWRYIKKPNQNYQIAHCYDIYNVYKGFVVFVVKEKHNGKIGYIMELIYDIDNDEVGKQLLSFAVESIKKENADCILSWSFEHSPNYSSYKKHFFINMPEKLRPIELHFGVRSFDSKFDELIGNRLNWYLSYSDSDTV
ncbi:GNAT family N-acetyltransferase [uncultured Flavobacterium sp.]|jgi:hypothetical protein|uniref:GNAT family N-acetyltransferase n=1 Tax=uncultured Flavobacterium sp. TaxID=165435 RepID=UPI0025957CF5|nr:GNAT family N-acetyltransferase [uncultured Flavobacterium sp.]